MTNLEQMRFSQMSNCEFKTLTFIRNSSGFIIEYNFLLHWFSFEHSNTDYNHLHMINETNILNSF